MLRRTKTKAQAKGENVFGDDREEVRKAGRERLRHAAEKAAHKVHAAWDSLKRLTH